MLTCLGRLLPMAVVLGLVLTASVLSGKGIVEVSDEERVPELWQLGRSGRGYLPSLRTSPDREEALDAGRDSLDVLDPGPIPDRALFLGLARGDWLAEGESVVAAEVTPLAVSPIRQANNEGSGVRANEGSQSASREQGLAPEGEVIDVGINRGDTATGSTGDLFWLTTYTCEEGYCGATASGLQVVPGMAACSDDWPFGTVFLIAGQWEVVCQDRGSGVVLPNHLDVFFDTAEEAAAWLAQVGDHAQVEVIP